MTKTILYAPPERTLGGFPFRNGETKLTFLGSLSFTMASIYMTFKSKTLTVAEIRQLQKKKGKEMHEERIEAGYRDLTMPDVAASKVPNDELIKMLDKGNVERLTKPIVAKGLKGNFKQTYKTNLMFVNFRPDHQMNRWAFDLFKGDPRTYNSMLDAASNVIASSGTPKGLITRFLAGASKPRVPRYGDRMNTYLYEFLKKSFVVGDLPDYNDVVPQDLLEPGDGSPPAIKINVDANSGFPFNDGTLTSFDFHFEKATAMFIAAKQGQAPLTQFLKENNWVNYYAMKNKSQVYSMDELETKVRPYFVLPNTKKFLYLCLAQPICDAFQSFQTEGFETTSSAYHFNWFDNGQNKLFERLWRYRDQPGKPDFVCFGDDSYLFWWDEGRLQVVALDISMLDGSVRDNFEAPIVNFLMDMWGDKLDSGWQNILLMMCKELFTQMVHIYNGEYVKRRGIPSGVPLTTVADMCVMGCYFGTLFKMKPDFSGVKQAELNGLFEQLRKDTGLTVKAGTEIIEDCGDIPTELPVFLGMKPNTTVGYPIFANIAKMYGSIFHPGDAISSKSSPISKLSVVMARSIGITLCGGFHYTEVYSLLKKAFDEAYKQCIAVKEKPTSVEIGYLMGCPVAEIAEHIHEEITMKGVFPPVEWFRGFFTGEQVGEPSEEDMDVPQEMKATFKRFDDDWAGSLSELARDTVPSNEVAYITGLFDRPVFNSKPIQKKEDRLPRQPNVVPLEQIEKAVSYKEKEALKDAKPIPLMEEAGFELPSPIIEDKPVKRERREDNRDTRKAKEIMDRRKSDKKDFDLENKADREFFKSIIALMRPQDVTDYLESIGYETIRGLNGKVKKYVLKSEDSSDGLDEL